MRVWASGLIAGSKIVKERFQIRDEGGQGRLLSAGDI